MKTLIAFACLFAIVYQTQAYAYDLQEDPVSGTCSALVKRVANPGVKGFDGRFAPGKWGVTQPILFIGSKRVDDPSVTDEISVKITEQKTGKPPGTTSSVCLVAEKLTFTFRAESHVSVIDWKHGLKPDSKCAKEWQRVRNIIRTHEPKHVKDIDDTIADANSRVGQLPPIKACGNSPDAAKANLGGAINTRLQTEITKITKDLDIKAAKRDVETAQMNCKLCNEGIAFKNVTVDCTIPNPQCSIRTGQKLEGKVCGDPVKSTWTIFPKYFAEGCGIPASNGKGDKPFENDCVEAGSPEEKRRIDIYRKSRASGGAGGWFCTYSNTPKPQVTIRSFRLPICSGAAEQTVTVDAEAAEGCN